MENRYYLKCINCGKVHKTDRIACTCGGILTPVYNIEYAKGVIPDKLSRAELGLKRFSPVLPVNPRPASQGEGDTPLVKSTKLGKIMNLKNLYFKNETLNPTGSFKDRSLAVMTAHAKERGYQSILLASTGNAGISLASYGKRCGMNTVVLVSEKTPQEKWRIITDLGATVIRVRNIFEGPHRELIELLNEVSSGLNAYNAFCWALANPISTEGVKTISYEIAYQFRGDVPDFIVTPVGGGDNLFGLWKGFVELAEIGIVDRIPRLIGVQSKNACPLVISYEKGLDHVVPVQNPDSIASGINVAFTGDHALMAIRKSMGTAVSVPDPAIIEGKRELMKHEGLMVETTSGCVIPAIKKLSDAGIIDPSDHIVCVLTGSGIKEISKNKLQYEPVIIEKNPNKIVQTINLMKGG